MPSITTYNILYILFTLITQKFKPFSSFNIVADWCIFQANILYLTKNYNQTRLLNIKHHHSH